MEPAFPSLIPLSEEAKFLGVSYKDRWNLLKPVIIQIYTGESTQDGKQAKMDDMVEFMKRYYQFHAT